MKTHRLRVSALHSVGMVKAGDDPESGFVFRKRRADPELKKAQSFAEIRGQRESYADVDQMTSDLQSAVMGAMYDDEVTDKAAFIASSLEQFIAAFQAQIPVWTGAQLEEITKEEEQHMPFDPKSLTGDAKTAWEALETRATDAEARAVELEKQIPKRPADVTKGMSPEALAEFAKTNEALAKANERIEKMETERKREHYITKAATLTHLTGAKPDDLGPVLMKIDGALAEAEREQFARWLKAWDEGLRASPMLREIGTGGTGDGVAGSAEAEVAALATEIHKSDPKLTPEAARARVWQTRPDLYQKYQNERRAVIRAHEEN